MDIPESTAHNLACAMKHLTKPVIFPNMRWELLMNPQALRMVLRETPRHPQAIAWLKHLNNTYP